MRGILSVLFLCALLAPDAHAADPVAGARVGRAPKYVGEPFPLQVTAEGFEDEPQPECTPGPVPDGVTLKLVGVTPRRSSFVQLFNGKRTEEHRVTFVYQYEVTIDTAGDVQLPRFALTQGTRRAATNALVVSARTVPIDPTMSIGLDLPEGPYAPGERVPVTLVWSFAGALDHASNVNIRSEFFDAFRFEEGPAPAQGLRLPIITKNGVQRIPASFQKTKIDGKPGIVLRAKRIWHVEKAGTFDFAPIHVQMERVTRWRRTLFGDREPAASRRVRATGKPLSIVVESLPTEGRPRSYAGALGRGFSLEASADRTVVRAGDPIRLTLTLRGDGNLEDAGLPALTDGGGLDPQDFRQADAEATGEVRDGVKVFEVTVRIEHDRVASIPPIEYGWWNPTLRKYETTRSKPIALQVGEAKIVSAKDVVSAGPTRTGDDAPADTPRPAAEIVSGADLALVEDLARLRARPTGPLLPWILYGASVLVLAGAFLQRRRAQVDPAERARRSAASAAAGVIAKARNMPPVDGAKQVAETLRALRAAHPDVLRPVAMDDVLARLDAIAYRPAADVAAVPPALFDAARDVAQEIGR